MFAPILSLCADLIWTAVSRNFTFFLNSLDSVFSSLSPPWSKLPFLFYFWLKFVLVCDKLLLQEPALLPRLKLFLSCVQKPPSVAISASPVTLLTLLLMMFWKHTPALTPALVRVQISSFHNGFNSVFAAFQSAVSLFCDVFQVILVQGSNRATNILTLWYQSVALYVDEMFLSFVFPSFVFSTVIVELLSFQIKQS